MFISSISNHRSIFVTSYDAAMYLSIYQASINSYNSPHFDYVPSTVWGCLHLLTYLILTEGLASLAWLAGLWNEGHELPFDIYDDPFFNVTRESVECQLLSWEIRRVVMIPGGAGWHVNRGIWASFIWQKIITSFRSIFQEISPNHV